MLTQNICNKADDDLWDGKLLSADEYFKHDIQKDAIRTDGHFGGSSL
jgi:hypothetical protein